MSDIRRLQVGQVVDFVIAYNERHEDEIEQGDPEKKPKMRLATQAEIDAFLG